MSSIVTLDSVAVANLALQPSREIAVRWSLREYLDNFTALELAQEAAADDSLPDIGGRGLVEGNYTTPFPDGQRYRVFATFSCPTTVPAGRHLYIVIVTEIRILPDSDGMDYH